VPGEAAAFATPTVTNDTGGLGTTVAHGESGIVLPKASPAAAYADAIQALVSDAARYYSLCETTRARYWRELNWDAAGERVAALLREAAGDR
ncbi:MAG: glycosyltransferase, partial [Chloroflexi bacterium]|nr:glycosyltransferase [Chloroflexota bacterium]